jgi:hypothetical protein
LFRIPVDCAGIPGCTARSRAAFGVQTLSESLWRHASCIIAEDPADRFRFGWNDLAIAGCLCAIVRCAGHLVAVAESASGLPELHAAAESSPSLVGEVFQEECVHRALEADMQMRDVALGERNDVDAGEGEALEKSGGVLLVAAESIERFGHDNVESSVQRVTHQCLETGPKQ